MGGRVFLALLVLLLGGICRGQTSESIKFFVREFEIQGNRTYSSEELKKLLKDYTNREITNTELKEAAAKINAFYANAGKEKVEVVIPDQDPASGVMTFQVNE